MEEIPIEIPKDLCSESKELIISFAEAMASKMREAEVKYNYSNEWTHNDWMDQCRLDMLGHILKGDPRDVAIYCAFLWYHKESTFKDVIKVTHQETPAEEIEESKH
jgi:hypothetical protein